MFDLFERPLRIQTILVTCESTFRRSIVHDLAHHVQVVRTRSPRAHNGRGSARLVNRRRTNEKGFRPVREAAVALHRLRRQIERPAEKKIRIRAEAPFISAIESPVAPMTATVERPKTSALRRGRSRNSLSRRPNGIGLRRDGSDRPRSLLPAASRRRDVRDAS